MSEAMLIRRGGAGLDFRVRGGTSAPAVPREKDIWVNTDQSISGVVFCAQQPQGQEGLLWVQTGRNSPVAFAADRRGQLYVYPDRCFQYLSAAWSAKTAKSFLGGAWTDWRSYLFREGEGPAADFVVTTYDGNIDAGAVSNSRIQISSTYNWNGMRGLSTQHAVDVSDFARIYVELIANTDTWRMGLAVSPIAYNTALLCSTGNIPILAGTRKTVAIDVSGMTGAYYIGGNNGGDVTTSVTIYNIWGE